MKKKHKIILIVSIVVGSLALASLTGLIVTGYEIGWGPFETLHDIKMSKHPGNSEKYNIDNVNTLSSSPLQGKNIAYLGSSVTLGASSLKTSFVEYISKRNMSTNIKEAVSGTTLVDNNKNSYVSRLKTIDKNANVDVFVVQLSTNDATSKKALGTINDNDTHTICGAINYIIDYVKDTWGCPVVYYTSPRFDSNTYQNMVTALNEIKEIKQINVIDMWNDNVFNNITAEQRSLYMADKIHPTKAGYLEWWTPKMEETLYKVVEK